MKCPTRMRAARADVGDHSARPGALPVASRRTSLARRAGRVFVFVFAPRSASIAAGHTRRACGCSGGASRNPRCSRATRRPTRRATRASSSASVEGDSFVARIDADAIPLAVMVVRTDLGGGTVGVAGAAGFVFAGGRRERGERDGGESAEQPQATSQGRGGHGSECYAPRPPR
jgi:hypothetical protein